MIALVDILPGAEVRGQGAPGAARLLDPEHGGDHLPQVWERAAPAAARGGEQRSKPVPLGLGDRARRPRGTVLGARLGSGKSAESGTAARRRARRARWQRWAVAWWRRRQRDQARRKLNRSGGSARASS